MRQSMGFSEPDRIVVRGRDLCDELIGKADFASVFFLELTGRLPDPGEARVVDAVLVTLMEHGITATSLAARLTHLGAPGSLQGAVAAGLLGAGETFLGAIEQCAHVLQELAAVESAGQAAAIDSYLDGVLASGAAVPGIGHPFHKPTDPRTPVLFALAEDALGDVPHVGLMIALQERAAERIDRILPINADGAVAAVLSDIGIPWSVCRGFAVVSRSAGLVGHVHDEASHPIARNVWDLADGHATFVSPDVKSATTSSDT